MLLTPMNTGHLLVSLSGNTSQGPHNPLDNDPNIFLRVRTLFPLPNIASPLAPYACSPFTLLPVNPMESLQLALTF